MVTVDIKSITKYYGEQKALNEVSLSINQGEVVGLLGPNGAGKSTLMKIITSFVPPTSGKVSIEGFDVQEKPLEIRKKIGYLPEHNPLYHDMYVKEYLNFVLNTYPGSQNNKTVIKDIIELTGLGPEQKKKIGALSKGYRQRVGLAQALIHNPDILILDEPTSGLDPNQIVEIRKIITDLGKSKTIILSTHIMQEVEAICDRVIIINKGEIVADDSAKNLQSQTSAKQVIRVEFDQVISIKKLQTISGVSVVNQIEQNLFLLEPKSKVDLRPAISKFANENSLLILTLQKEEHSLEEAFKKLTNN